PSDRINAGPFMTRWRVLGVLSAALLLAVALFTLRSARHEAREVGEDLAESYPSHWFGAQRAWPLDRIPQERYRAAVEQALLDRELAEPAGNQIAVGPLSWTQAGPYNIGGRVTAIAATPGGATVYLGSAAGGVFKSTNSGVNWTPVFDPTGVFSIGAITIDPTDSNTVYVGTGEA